MITQSVLIILGIFVFYQLILRLARRYWKFPAPSFIGKFLDSKQRKVMQPPEKIISRSGIDKGMTVLEIGCGSGAFTTDVARAIGNKGILSALDIEIKMLKQVASKLNRIENKDIKNVKLVQASAYALPFSKESFDIVYMVAVFQEIPNKEKALKEINRVLKNNGILSISEFIVDPDYPLKSTTIKMVQRTGFNLNIVSGNFFNYTITFGKNKV
jgi:ubiquinone/menaquinone biosynthesis C-methylase UbiE